MTRFVDNFWDTEFNSTNGYDVILKHMKDGREMCKDYEEFLKQRAKAEEAFGKTLIKISKSSGGKDELGHLKTSWDEVVKQTEICGTSHVSISANLTDEAKKVEEFRELQKEKRRKSEEAIKKLNTTKREQYNKVTHSKRSYESKCKEADLAEDNFMKGRLVFPQKEQDKMALKKEKIQQAATLADSQYQKDVSALELTRQQWEEQMAQVCVIFQQLEMERICFLRNAMWVFANIISMQCCKDDEKLDDIRNVLSECSEDNDIQLFISQKCTGRIKPAPIVYECYYKDSSLIAKPSGGITNGRNRQSLPPLPKVDQKRSLPKPPPKSPIKSGMNDGIYSSMGEYSTGVVSDDTSSGKYMAKYDYEAQGNEELHLKTGDILNVIASDDVTWWYAEVNGKKGHVPAEYLAPYTDTGEEEEGGHTTFL